MRFTFLIAAAAVLFLGVTLTDDCPTSGSARTARLAALNKLKNRKAVPAKADFDHAVTLANILRPGNDSKRWDTQKAVRITGYVYDVKPGGEESCNCESKDLDKRDTHIELLADPMHDKKTLRMVVEVTPHMRAAMKAKKTDWSTKALRSKLLGRWVTFEGWLLFDEEHTGQAENTNPGKEKNWRATAWEIHPVTKMEVTRKP